MKVYVFSISRFLITTLKLNGKKAAKKSYERIKNNPDCWENKFNGKQVDLHDTKANGGFTFAKEWCNEIEL